MMTDSLMIPSAILLIGFALLAVMIIRNTKSRKDSENDLAGVLMTMQETSNNLGATQTVLADRLQQGQTQLNQRLDSLQGRLGDSLAKQTEKTGESLKSLHERLAVIDAAQQNITDLSQQMVGLQDILSNKQARGAFGEIQLNDLVTNTLPPNAYEFQSTLSNGKRPDCLLLLPLPPGPIVIDAKFPLNSYEALRNAENDVAKIQATRAFTADIKKHITDIADKYIIPGETAESALMFLPSEAVYAELHANFRNLVEESYKRRVWIVSPTTLMATLNTVRAVLKDARMKEQAGLIQDQVLKMMEDVSRLDGRVNNLRTHFTQAEKDIALIETSSKKINSHGEKIEAMQLGNDDSPAEDLAPASPSSPVLSDQASE
ncbi:MAG: DNA recombination protein RmuC [Rhodospirillales bacterium]|nr:DNA recombination protein RmuC [Rhodospirillales bacterium]